MSYQPYSLKERTSKLNQIYDEALDYCAEQVTDGKFKGTLASITLMERSRVEMQELECTSTNAHTREPITISFMEDDTEVQVDA